MDNSIEMVETIHLSNLLQLLIGDQSQFCHLMLNQPDPMRFTLLLLGTIFICGWIHGASLGVKSSRKQFLSSIIKTPFTSLLALLITFPLLAVILYSTGSKLPIFSVLGLTLTPIALCSLILASGSPALTFFRLSCGYHFGKLMHVFAFGLSAFYGLLILHRIMGGLTSSEAYVINDAQRIFFFWSVIYSFTGAQVVWAMRPFLGEPGLPFEFIRKSKNGMNFYSAIFSSISQVLSESVEDEKKDES